MLIILISAVLFQGSGTFQNNDWINTNGAFGGSVWALTVTGQGNLLAGTLKNGVYYSADNAQNWEQTNLDNITVYDFALTDGLAFAASKEGIYQSTNDGKDWSLLDSELNGVSIQSIHAVEGTLFALNLTDGIFRSTDLGNTWTINNEGIPLPFGISLASNDGNIFAGINNGVFQSSDNGDTWRRLNTNFSNVRANSIIANANGIYVGTQDGIYHSRTDGDTWTDIGDGLNNREIYDLAYSRGTMYAGTREGVYSSSNNGRSWKLSGWAENAVYSIAAFNDWVFIGGNSGIFYRN
ncbi:MAG: hypothetical protein WD037_00285 [Balneolales bacterium]